MKYCVENQLSLFKFHDAEFSFTSFDNYNLIVSVNHLNIHKYAKENPYDCDMEIDSANISFYEIQIISFEPMRAYKVDDDGNWYTNEPQIIFSKKDAEIHFLNELKNGITINGIDIHNKNNKTFIEISTCAKNSFFVTFSFNNVAIEWDEYCKKAWYELHKQYKNKVVLVTPNGELETDIHIVCHEEDMYYMGKLEKAPTVNIGIQYQSNEVWGRGKDYLWIDAFADLQKQLPRDVTLKCCLTCRHGNMCPYGNKPGEVFCTKDLIITSKEDMCRLFDSEKAIDDMKKRSRFCANNCEDYQQQSRDNYTYNDYLYELDK